MKNKFKNFLYLLLFLLFFMFKNVNSNEIKFEASNIKTLNNELVTATGNVVITDQFKNKIFAEKLIIDNEKRYTLFLIMLYMKII